MPHGKVLPRGIHLLGVLVGEGHVSVAYHLGESVVFHHDHPDVIKVRNTCGNWTFLRGGRACHPCGQQAQNRCYLIHLADLPRLAELPDGRGDTGRARWHALCESKVTPQLQPGKSSVNGPEKWPQAAFRAPRPGRRSSGTRGCAPQVLRPWNHSLIAGFNPQRLSSES